MSSMITGISAAVARSFDERNSSEIDFNRGQSSTPLPSKIFCDSAAQVYESWFVGVRAGFMPPAPAGLTILQQGLRSFNFTTWGSAFAVYWQTTAWLPDPSGLYVSGVTMNAPAIGVALQSEINNLLLNEKPRAMSGSPNAFAERIAEILSTYTTKLQVQAAVSIPPYTMVETVREI